MPLRRLIASLLSIAAVAVLGAPAAAASPSTALTSDLIPESPSGSWTASDSFTGPITISDFYGRSHSTPPGFVDAYRKGWTSPEVGLVDYLLHYNSVFWATFALGGFKGSAQKSVKRTSFQAISGFGTGAFEVTYSADSRGFNSDWIYFAQGDYVAAVVAYTTGNIAHNALLDQAKRQFELLPIPTAEYQSIGNGFFFGVMVVGLILAVMAASLVVVVLLVRRRPTPAVVGRVGSPVIAQLSNDRRHWWDGQAWQDTAVRIPPWAQISPDGSRWWDGATWRPMPSAVGEQG